MVSAIFDSLPSHISWSVLNQSNMALAGSFGKENDGSFSTIFILTAHHREKNTSNKTTATINDKLFESFTNTKDVVETASKKRNEEAFKIYTFEDLTKPELSLKLAKFETEFMKRRDCKRNSLARASI